MLDSPRSISADVHKAVTGSYRGGLGMLHRADDGYESCMELAPALDRKIKAGDPRFLALLGRAEEILNDALPRRTGRIPVDLTATLDHFRMGQVIVEGANRSGRLGGLRRIDGRWRPVVYRENRIASTTEFTSQERFTIAHEIAHAIVEDALFLRPERASQYWALEAACNQFAARLLIPESAVRDQMVAIRGPASTLRAIRSLAASTATSLVTSSRRLLEFVPGTSAWGFSPPRSDAGAPQAFVVAWSAGHRKELLTRHQRLDDSHSLYGLVSGDPRLHCDLAITLGQGVLSRDVLDSGFVIAVWHNLEAEPTPTEHYQIDLPLGEVYAQTD